MMLASRGFVYLSEESAGEFDRFHKNCDCRIVPGYPGMEIEGYDLDYYRDVYAHPGDHPEVRDAINARRRELYAERKQTERYEKQGIGYRCATILGSGTGGQASGKPYDLGDKYSFDASDPEVVAEVLTWCKNAIRNEPVENALVMTADGRLWHSVGTANAVSIEGASLAGSHIVNNHTRESGSGSFGADDFIDMRDHPEMDELWAVDWQYDYKASHLNMPSSMTYNDAMANPSPGLPNDDMKHSIMEYLDELGCIDYKRTPI